MASRCGFYHKTLRELLASVLQPLASTRVFSYSRAAKDLEVELLDEARLEDGLEAGRLAPEFRERGLEFRDGHGVDRRGSRTPPEPRR